MEIILENEEQNKGENLRSYKDFKKDSYKYRVDEILDEINFNTMEFKEKNKRVKELYKELETLIKPENKFTLIHYSDAQEELKSFEEYTLAEKIYEDLEK